MKEEKVKFCPSCGKIDVYLQTFKYYQMAGCFDCWWFGEKVELMNEREKIKFDRKHKKKCGYAEG